MAKNNRQNYIQEATGIRVVSMFVQEFFGWGWLPNTQENDDGLDGFIYVRDSTGRDLGIKIHVQIKSGLSYYKGVDNKDRLKLQPYSPKSTLEKHLKIYAKQVEPTILVYVTSEWEGKKDLYRPWAWWVRMDNYKYDNSAYVYIDRKQRFGEHSKKDLYNLVSKSLKWTECKTIHASSDDNKHFNTIGNIKAAAKSIYNSLRTKDIFCPALKNAKVVFNRIGWHHICNGKRGLGRIRNSFGLMPIVPQIIENTDNWIYARKSQYANQNHVFYTLRANVIIKNESYKVQVIIRRQSNSAGIHKYIFYSVHIVNK